VETIETLVKSVFLNRGYTFPLEVRSTIFFSGMHALKILTQAYTPRNLINVMSTVVSAVTFMRGKALKDRLFKLFCNEVGDQHNRGGLSHRSIGPCPRALHCKGPPGGQ